MVSAAVAFVVLLGVAIVAFPVWMTFVASTHDQQTMLRSPIPLLPGPYLTQLFGDLGAEVIKIETPRLGDYTRIATPEMGLGKMFEAVNRGKKSVAVNFQKI